MKKLWVWLPLLWSAFVVAKENDMPVANTEAELQAQLMELRVKHHAPGLSYAVFDQNGVRFVGVDGVKEQGNSEKVGENTLFQIGSITKMVTAIAVLQLIEQGHFTLDTPVTTLLPALPANNPFADQVSITVRHLLSHTAGFDDMHFKAFLSPIEKRGGHLQQSLAQPEALTSRWRPGRFHSYSNPSYIALGAILEAHYQQPWDDIVTRQVLRPLGMQQVLALTSAVQRLDHAAAHRGDGMEAVGVKFHQAQADGALWSNARQLAELGRFMLTDGRSHPGVLKPETVQMMKQPQAEIAQQTGLQWGYGMGAYYRHIDDDTVQGHTGGVLGALASLSWLPDNSAGYVVLTNSDNVLRAFEKPIVRFLKQQQLPTAFAQQPINGPLDGWFRGVNSRNEIFRLPDFLANVATLSLEQNALMMRAVIPGTGEAKLLHYGDNRFADADTPSVINAALLRDTNGEVKGLLLDDTYMERVSAFAAIAPAVSVIAALFLLLTAPFGRRRVLHNRWLRRLPTIALALLVIGIVAAMNFSIETVMAVNWQTLTVWFVTTTLPFVALAGVALSIRFWREETATIAKWRCLLGSVGALTLSLWFAAFQWFALAIWAW